MKLLRTLTLAAAVLAATAVGLPAQESPLQLFPDDTLIIVSVDLARIMELLPAEMAQEIREGNIENVGFDFTARVDTMLIGIGDLRNPRNAYAVLSGDFSIAEVTSILAAEGKLFEEVQIGSLSAVRIYDPEDEEGEDDAEGEDDPESEDGYLAAIGSGTFVAGSRDGLETYEQVRTGQLANATANQMLVGAMVDVDPGGFFFLAGVVPEQARSMLVSQAPEMAELQYFSLSASHEAESLDYRVVLGAGDPEALPVIQENIAEQFAMLRMMDASGALGEVIDGMEYSTAGNKLMITGNIADSTLATLFEQFSNMIGMRGGVER